MTKKPNIGTRPATKIILLHACMAIMGLAQMTGMGIVGTGLVKVLDALDPLLSFASKAVNWAVGESFDYDCEKAAPAWYKLYHGYYGLDGKNGDTGLGDCKDHVCIDFNDDIPWRFGYS